MQVNKISQGKVRDIYEIAGGKLVIVTTDRISAYDVVLPKPVPGKGRILNAMSLFWFDYTKDITPNHIISSDICDMPEYFQNEIYKNRTVMVKKLNMLPFEFIVRGYMYGHMWEEYIKNPATYSNNRDGGCKLAEKLDSPRLFASKKMQTGHDEYVPLDYVANEIGDELVKNITGICLKLYGICYEYAYKKGIIIADTKFELGIDPQGQLVVADEIFTPDSSRFWDIDEYKAGERPKSFDKQLLRDWLSGNKVRGEMQYDNVPDEIYKKTAEIYAMCLRMLTNE